MGNHDVGRAMAAAAEVFWLTQEGHQPPRELALRALEAVGNKYRGADAEFDDELSEETPLSKLVAIAFDANNDEVASLKGALPSESDEDRGMVWFDGPYQRFRDHFQFC